MSDDEQGRETQPTEVVCAHCQRLTVHWEAAPAAQGGQVAGPWCWACLSAYDRGRDDAALPPSPPLPYAVCKVCGNGPLADGDLHAGRCEECRAVAP